MAKRKNKRKNKKFSLPFGMSKKSAGGIAVLLVIALAVAVLFAYFPEYADFLFGEGNIPTSPTPAEGESAEFHFIDVGQGDGMLIRTSSGDIVIDAGPSSTEDDFVEYLKQKNVKSIEYFVLTHPHADHIGGADAVLEEFDVKRVIIPKTDCTTSMYMKVMNLIEKEECEVIEAKVGKEILLGSFKMTILAPEKISYESYNNNSVVIRAELGETSVLLTGDAEKVSENEMIESISNSLLDCDILKVGHHGSSTSTVKAFFAAVSPEYAVISCGEANEYGHPHNETMDTLSALERAEKLYRTDISGTVIFSTDGKSIHIVTEK